MGAVLTERVFTAPADPESDPDPEPEGEVMKTGTRLMRRRFGWGRAARAGEGDWISVPSTAAAVVEAEAGTEADATSARACWIHVL